MRRDWSSANLPTPPPSHHGTQLPIGAINPRKRAAPNLVMGKALKFVLIKVVAFAKLLDGVIPGESVRPFVEESVDGLLLLHAVAEEYDISVLTADALAEGVFRQIGSTDDDWH